ncbi:stress protein [Sutcliffiella deserti]|uniref:stress protein n=1 Tax=Sutcliffiella deserti TaxID=2875501 RepID=UPI001CBE56DE|nr:stress protein [Sutcliffiella deserti]
MKGKMQKGLELQRDYYIKKLLLIGVYDLVILEGMTIRELSEEYHYFYYDIPSKKLTPKRENKKEA